MSGVCPAPNIDAGVVRGVLATVDCNVRHYSQAGYLALTGPASIFPTALTVLLTLYVAILGYRLMFGVGGARLADAPIMALKIGFILALTLNWTTFQTLVFDVALKGPVEVAQIMARPEIGSGSKLTRQPIDGLQVAYDQIVQDAEAFGKSAGPNPQVLKGGDAAAADGLWKASSALFMSTAGVLAISTIAVGVLVSIGPIFIALFLFDATRGLFAGWMRALVAAAIAPLVCWITTTILLVVIEPWLVELAKGRDAGHPDPNTATAVISLVFVFAAAQAALVAGGGAIAGGFQLNFGAKAAKAEKSDNRPEAQSPAVQTRAEQVAANMQRSGYVSSIATLSPSPGIAAMSVGGSGAGRDAAPQTVARVGDSYRRGAFADRITRQSGRAE